MSVLRLRRTLSRRASLLFLGNITFIIFLEYFLYLNRTSDTKNYLYLMEQIYSNANHSVTIFQPDLTDCGFKAAMKVPSSDYISICIHNPHSDLFVSKYVNDFTVWEFEHVLEIEFLFQKDEREKLNRKKSYPTNSRKVLSRDNSSLAGAQALSMLDLGCNIGVYTLSAAKMGHQVLAVDAMQESLQLLATSLRMNHLADRVTLLHNALSDVREMVQMQVRINNPGASKIVPVQRRNKRPPVSALCLDDFISNVRTGRVLIKIDIEGSEVKVLRCASLFFETIEVPYIFMKWVIDSSEFNIAYLIHFFSSRGYLPYASPYNKYNESLTPEFYSSWPKYIFWIQKK